jgi:hypothetical protein
MPGRSGADNISIGPAIITAGSASKQASALPVINGCFLVIFLVLAKAGCLFCWDDPG